MKQEDNYKLKNWKKIELLDNINAEKIFLNKKLKKIQYNIK